MKEGLVSIIMPSWNTERFIGEAIESVLSQTYKDWELLIVDDCSTDHSDEKIRQYRDERIRYFRNANNEGAAVSRNRALREAKGEWIAFLDSDDLWVPYKLERQLAFMKSNRYCFSYTEYEKIDEKGDPLHIYISGPAVVDRQKMYNYDYIGQLTMMYSAKYLGLVQTKDIKKNNDYALKLQLINKKGVECQLLKENLAKYRVRNASISHDRLSRKLKSHYDLFHVCEDKSSLASLYFAGRNMFFGVLKKISYEKHIGYEKQYVQEI